MNSLLLVVASVAVGIDYGYQPLESGGLEYIIQFEPQQLDALNQGNDLVSEVPADLDIRRFRIQVGNDKLPRELGSQPYKRGAANERRGAVNSAAQRERSQVAADEVTEEPAEDAFEPKQRGAGDASAQEQADANEPEGPALAGEPAGPDQTFSPEDRRNSFTAGSFFDRSSPRKLTPADDAGPLSSKSVEAAAFADRAKQRKTSDVDDNSSHNTRKPALSDSNRSRSKAAADADEAEPEKPWMTLVWTIAALCVSLGLNVYLGWIAWTARERYRLVLERTHGEPVEV